MLRQIHVSPEMVLYIRKDHQDQKNHKDKTEIGILDPKTRSVAKQYKNKNNVMMKSSMVYSKKYQQMITLQEQKTFMDIWNIDKEDPICTVNLPQPISSFFLEESESFLVGGSKNGSVYVWEIPTGLLLRKFTAHHSEIIHVSVDKNLYITSATQNQIKSWRLVDIFNIQSEAKHYKYLTTKEKIIDIINTVERYYILTFNSILIYVKLTGERQRIIQTNSATCFTTNQQNTHLYVGSLDKTIYEYRINFMKEYRQISGNMESGLQFRKTPQERKLEGHTGEITTMTYLNSLKYLVSGSKNGQIIVWSNGTIKSKSGYISEICLLKCIQRPQHLKQSTTEHKNREQGIKMKIKIKSLNKHQYSADNPGNDVFQFVGQIAPVEQDKYQDYQNIVKMINNNGHQQQIQRLKERNKKLAQGVNHYSKLFSEKYDISSKI